MGTPMNGAVFDGEPRSVKVRVVTDPPGRTETPALPWVCVAIHLGRAVYMHCKRGGHKHSGLGVHADIDVIPAFEPAASISVSTVLFWACIVVW